MDRTKMWWVGLGVLSVLTLVLIFQNTQVVVARLLFWRLEMSLALLVFLVALLGAGVGFLLARWGGSRGSRPSS